MVAHEQPDDPFEMSEPVEQPIDGVLDLHNFRPNEVKSLLPDYFEACLEQGIRDVRIVHGKGTGALRELVHAQLRKSPHVASFELGGSGGGAWGATVVRLRGDVT